MCGLTGAVWDRPSLAISLPQLNQMMQAIVHRGPDDAGSFFSTDRPVPQDLSRPQASTGAGGSHVPEQAALGFRRLSIIDLAGGHQPLCNEDGRVWIVFNGEIYNYRDLQHELEQRGHQFRTSSDTEAIVHAYEEFGPACVHRLRGMFAFAIWDQRPLPASAWSAHGVHGPGGFQLSGRSTTRLFLARDRLGKKPLVYRQEPGRLLFASELKSLLTVPGVPREVNRRAIDDYLTYQYVPHPDCILNGFHKLPPAHCALYEAGQLQVQRYWRPGYQSLDCPPDPAAEPTFCDQQPADELRAAVARDPHAALRSQLTEAVRLRMRSDVPLGAFLSGGIDSTIIAGLMQSLSDRPVKTFSIGFPVAQFDERSFAREAAQHLHTEHHEQVVTPSVLDQISQLSWHYDEPFADSSAIPMLALAQMTRAQVTVALSGDGGDELFAGYERYRAVALAERFDRWPGWLRQAVTHPVWQRIPSSVRQKSKRRRLKRLLAALADPPQHRYLHWINIFDETRRRSLYTPEMQTALDSHDAAWFLNQAYEECPHRDFVSRTTCADLLTYLPCDILNKVDIATMAHSLEARCPFLDQDVVRLAALLPTQQKLRSSVGKRILTETFRDLLPESIQRRSKMGFGVPLDHWFRNELRNWVQSILLDPRSLNRGYFRPVAVQQLVAEHLTSQFDHSARLWALIMLEMWHQRFIDV